MHSSAHRLIARPLPRPWSNNTWRLQLQIKKMFSTEPGQMSEVSGALTLVSLGAGFPGLASFHRYDFPGRRTRKAGERGEKSHRLKEPLTCFRLTQNAFLNCGI
ncbi:hypothetical protein B0T17DRAFT_526010 [Bombardia bombarda]|uniref:Uncharacterized protein n=1 Tax=Bombardia bombarda TaxID=252184 RepID=A0AA39X982_9PEZI|nr:hypothetical protein B0T17DRAFT_526010 [Bombardia bombarda]